MRIVVVFESLTGNTELAARCIGTAARARGAEVSVHPITSLDLTALAAADVVVVGSWTDGFILFGQRPGRAGRLRGLPVLDGKRAAVFCTYAVHPRGTLAKMRAIVAGRGAEVVAEAAFHRKRLDEGVEAFVDEVLAAVPA